MPADAEGQDTADADDVARLSRLNEYYGGIFDRLLQRTGSLKAQAAGLAGLLLAMAAIISGSLVWVVAGPRTFYPWTLPVIGLVAACYLASFALCVWLSLPRLRYQELQYSDEEFAIHLDLPEKELLSNNLFWLRGALKNNFSAYERDRRVLLWAILLFAGGSTLFMAYELARLWALAGSP